MISYIFKVNEIVQLTRPCFDVLPLPLDNAHLIIKICPGVLCINHSHSSSLCSTSNLRAVIHLLVLQQSASYIC